MFQLSDIPMKKKCQKPKQNSVPHDGNILKISVHIKEL